jgi:hypothetical protein
MQVAYGPCGRSSGAAPKTSPSVSCPAANSRPRDHRPNPRSSFAPPLRHRRWGLRTWWTSREPAAQVSFSRWYDRHATAFPCLQGYLCNLGGNTSRPEARRSDVCGSVCVPETSGDKSCRTRRSPPRPTLRPSRRPSLHLGVGSEETLPWPDTTMADTAAALAISRPAPAPAALDAGGRRTCAHPCGRGSSWSWAV